jgi:AbiU2
MTKERIQKNEAHMGHLLDTFLQLREAYALLDPMLFEQKVVETFGWGKKARGFQVIRASLSDSCILNLVAILDDKENTPCVKKIFLALDDASFRDALRDKFAAQYDDPSEGKVKFDDTYNAGLKRWTSLKASGKPTAFKTIRDKLIAHKELKKNGDEYERLDLAPLGLKNNDIRKVLDELEEIIYCINLLVRRAGFDFKGSNKHYKRDSSAFWQL